MIRILPLGAYEYEDMKSISKFTANLLDVACCGAAAWTPGPVCAWTSAGW